MSAIFVNELSTISFTMVDDTIKKFAIPSQNFHNWLVSVCDVETIQAEWLRCYCDMGELFMTPNKCPMGI